MSQRLFAFLEKEGKVVLDLIEVMVEEKIHVPLCYRCCAFRHVAKYCRAPTAICSECGDEEHERKDCKANTKKCVNCRCFLGKKLEHLAIDVACQVSITFTA